MWLGKLADQHVGVVLLEDAEVNALVMADGAPGKAGLSVQINPGMLASTLTADQIVGVLLHELTHAARLHVVAEVADKLQQFYVAGSPEPIGAMQIDHQDVHDAASAWVRASWVRGLTSDPAFGALPIDGDVAAPWDTWSQVQYTCGPEIQRVQNARDWPPPERRHRRDRELGPRSSPRPPPR